MNQADKPYYGLYLSVWTISFFPQRIFAKKSELFNMYNITK